LTFFYPTLSSQSKSFALLTPFYRRLGHKNAVEALTLLPMPVHSIRLGQTFSALLGTDGELYTFGFGGSSMAGLGNLGHGNGESYLEPKLVESLVEDGCLVKDVQVGESHMTVLTTEGEVLTCGAGSYGRLGSFDSMDQLYLEPTELLTSDVTHIAGGKSFTLALTSDGVVHGWGRNHKGQVSQSGSQANVFQGNVCSITLFTHKDWINAIL
jgi:alpha-tubulin suppressor-like RCC1 family protein